MSATPLELLAPARDLACGLAAIDHGADAVYIGGPRLGARAAAANSIDDIAALCRHAHAFRARVYATLNTIVYAREWQEALDTAEALYAAGADAVLVQDLALGEELLRRGHTVHASTQADCRTAERLAWLHQQGYSRIVVAREMPLAEISRAHRLAPSAEIEAFVHGALCVSYSGQCYASQYCFGRSANRGECAQFCRLPFDLVDADGRVVERQRHLLSLHDMSRLDRLADMAAAGVVSFKIEGRLKGEDYVKNVVAAYSAALDRVVAAAPDRYRRQSLGRARLTFQPDIEKTFHRGYTAYFLDGQHGDEASPLTPKATGQYVGVVKGADRHSLRVATTVSLANGDGLCFLDHTGALQGFRVNRVEARAEAADAFVYPHAMPVGCDGTPRSLRGVKLWRNSDAAFLRQLAGNTAKRTIGCTLALDSTPDGYALTLGLDESGETVRREWPAPHDAARTPQGENLRRQLAKLGATHYACREVRLGEGVAERFIPASLLGEWRRQIAAAMDAQIAGGTPASGGGLPAADNQTENADNMAENASAAAANSLPKGSTTPFPATTPLAARFPYLLNAANPAAAALYARHGVACGVSAYELTAPQRGAVLMQCKHCIRHALGFCTKTGRTAPWREPLALRLADGRTFPLAFDCRRCEMLVRSE